MLEMEELTGAFSTFEESSKVTVTQDARKLILSLINSIELDRPEVWEVAEEKLPAYYERWISILPEVLSRLTYDLRLSKQITGIDIVFWTGQNLASLGYKFHPLACPFPGADELPPTPMMMLPWSRKWKPRR